MGTFSRRFFSGAPDGTATGVEMMNSRFVGVKDINRRGDFVGFEGFLAGALHAVAYSNGRFLPLDSTIDTTLTLLSADAVADSGHIVGTGRRIGGGPIVPVLLIPRAPFAPQNLAFMVTGRTVTLQWQASLGALDYILEAGSVSGARNLFNGGIGSQSGLSVVAPPGRYYVRVRARNQAGTGPPSSEVVIDVP